MRINKTRLLHVHYNFMRRKAYKITILPSASTKMRNEMGTDMLTHTPTISMLKDDKTPNFQIKWLLDCSIFSWQFSLIFALRMKTYFIMLHTHTHVHTANLSFSLSVSLFLSLSAWNLICKYFQDFAIFSVKLFLYICWSWFFSTILYRPNAPEYWMYTILLRLQTSKFNCIITFSFSFSGTQFDLDKFQCYFQGCVLNIRGILCMQITANNLLNFPWRCPRIRHSVKWTR